MGKFKATHSDHNEFVDPVEAGDAHGKRPLDKKQGDGEPDTAVSAKSGAKDLVFGKVSEAEFVESILSASDAEVLSILEDVSDEALASLSESPMSKHVVKRIEGARATKSKMVSCTKEDVDLLFAGAGVQLSEEFTSKAFTLFEGAVSGKVEAIRSEMETSYGASLQETTEEWKMFLEERLDTYLDLFVEEFFEKNQVAIESGIKQEFAEQVMSSVSSIVESFGVELDDDKVDIAESLSKELVSKEGELNEALESNAKLRDQVKTFQLKEAFDTITSDLTDVDREKLSKLSENVTFESVEDYTAKVNVLKEGMNALPKAAAAAEINKQVEITESAEAAKPALSDWQRRILVAARGEI